MINTRTCNSIGSLYTIRVCIAKEAPLNFDGIVYLEAFVYRTEKRTAILISIRNIM